jgi:hypothetical protein
MTEFETEEDKDKWYMLIERLDKLAKDNGGGLLIKLPEDEEK